MKHDSPTDELTPDELKHLFATVARALTFDALRLKPREKVMVLLLACESFGEGCAHGAIHYEAWRERLRNWRSNELKVMLADFVKAAWVTVDRVEGTFRLAPDRLPGWADVVHLRMREAVLPIVTPEDLDKMFARLSQHVAGGHDTDGHGRTRTDTDGANGAAARGAKISQGMPAGATRCENFAGGEQRAKAPPNVPVFAGSDESLRNGDGVPLREFAGDLVALKKRHKGIKPLQDFVTLKEALLEVETTRDEAAAYEAMCGILGGVVMEGGDLDAAGKVRYGDGGKWRNRWKTNRAKTFRVMASLVEEIKENRVKSRGGRVEEIWKEFSEVPR